MARPSSIENRFFQALALVLWLRAAPAPELQAKGPTMTLPTTNFDPGFRITRASHVVLTVRDIAASRQFYEQVIGLILTAEQDDTLYFRGVEEACHHSLVLRKASDAHCARIGLRVFSE